MSASLAGWSLLSLASVAALACTTQPSDNVTLSGAAGSSNSGPGSGGAATSAGAANVAGGAGEPAVVVGGGASGSPEIPADAGPSQVIDSGLADGDAEGPLDASTQLLPKRVLLYHYSTLDIASVPIQLGFFERALSAWGYEAEDSVDPAAITDQNLERYAAVAMVNTCFEPFGKGKPDTPQSQVLQRLLQRGGGLFGTHCASVTFQSAAPPVLYNQLLGGRGGGGSFDGKSACRTLGAHPTISTLPASFSFTGNLDNADFLRADSSALVKCQWQGGAAKDVAVSWYRSEGLGRVFYTNFAKVAADLTDPMIGPHIVSGLAWVLHVPG